MSANGSELLTFYLKSFYQADCALRRVDSIREKQVTLERLGALEKLKSVSEALRSLRRAERAKKEAAAAAIARILGGNEE